MSAAEFGRWVDYFNKYGRLTPARMFDEGPALLASIIANALGAKTSPQDFLVRTATVFDAAEVSAADIVRELMGGK